MAGHNGNGVAPAAYPPPVDPQTEFIKRELDPEDERIEVGVAIVGGGTAGLATANRLLQLLARLRTAVRAPIVETGDEAHLPYAERAEVHFVREDGLWKIENPD